MALETPPVRRLVAACAVPQDALDTLAPLISGFARSGTVVRLVCFSHGDDPDRTTGMARIQEFADAVHALGVDEVHVLECPDVCSKSPEYLIDRIIEAAGGADALLVVASGDSRPDVAAVADAAAEAGRRIGSDVYSLNSITGEVTGLIGPRQVRSAQSL
jgi:LmbE family N-acetylglucosaminyl deacetylase